MYTCDEGALGEQSTRRIVRPVRTQNTSEPNQLRQLSAEIEMSNVSINLENAKC